VAEEAEYPGFVFHKLTSCSDTSTASFISCTHLN
jgi:hypothetical protein